MNFDFGNRIKSLRLSRFMAQEQLVQKLGDNLSSVLQTTYHPLAAHM